MSVRIQFGWGRKDLADVVTPRFEPFAKSSLFPDRSGAHDLALSDSRSPINQIASGQYFMDAVLYTFTPTRRSSSPFGSSTFPYSFNYEDMGLLSLLPNPATQTWKLKFPEGVTPLSIESRLSIQWEFLQTFIYTSRAIGSSFAVSQPRARAFTITANDGTATKYTVFFQRGEPFAVDDIVAKFQSVIPETVATVQKDASETNPTTARIVIKVVERGPNVSVAVSTAELDTLALLEGVNITAGTDRPTNPNTADRHIDDDGYIVYWTGRNWQRFTSLRIIRPSTGEQYRFGNYFQRPPLRGVAFTAGPNRPSSPAEGSVHVDTTGATRGRAFEWDVATNAWVPQEFETNYITMTTAPDTQITVTESFNSTGLGSWAEVSGNFQTTGPVGEENPAGGKWVYSRFFSQGTQTTTWDIADGLVGGRWERDGTILEDDGTRSQLWKYTGLDTPPIGDRRYGIQRARSNVEDIDGNSQMMDAFQILCEVTPAALGIADLSTVNARVGALETQVNANVDDIDDNESDITAIRSAITRLEDEIQSLGGHGVNIQNLMNQVLALQAQVSVNIDDIDGNEADIAGIQQELQRIEDEIAQLEGRTPSEIPIVDTAGYCTIGDVEGETKEEYGTNTVPKSSQVQTYITDGYRRINAIIEGLGYTIPIDRTESPESYRIVQEMNKIYAAYRATLRPGTDDFHVAFKDQYDEDVEELKSGLVVLRDAERGDEVPTGRVDTDVPFFTSNDDDNS